MPISLKLHHTSFPVRDINASTAFYENVLGLQRIPRPDLGIPGVWLAVGDKELHLIEHAPSVITVAGASPDPRTRHEAFAVVNIDAAKVFFTDRGITFMSAPTGIRQFWIADPDGHVLEFIQS